MPPGHPASVFPGLAATDTSTAGRGGTPGSAERQDKEQTPPVPAPRHAVPHNCPLDTAVPQGGGSSQNNSSHQGRLFSPKSAQTACSPSQGPAPRCSQAIWVVLLLSGTLGEPSQSKANPGALPQPRARGKLRHPEARSQTWALGHIVSASAGSLSLWYQGLYPGQSHPSLPRFEIRNQWEEPRESGLSHKERRRFLWAQSKGSHKTLTPPPRNPSDSKKSPVNQCSSPAPLPERRRNRRPSLPHLLSLDTFSVHQAISQIS